MTDRPPGPGPVAVDILVEAADWGSEADWRPLVEVAVAATVAAGAFEAPAGAEVSVVLTDDARIRVLNRDFRGFDKPTNVLSFPGSDEDEDLGPLLGDIVVARETAAREALDEGRPLAHHVSHLIVHGLLHLVGYDHEEEADAEAMERLETRILAGLGIPDPYAGTVPETAGGGAIETKAR
ncbi:rRNA maturation RNase YbeY [Prosthecomicrobium sp. N25]|uniref:rRNA maturation RNase YbeY n=1 Tax=Prosthecomicrobium sp. N25 TaxID=3129254 RepID=UPI003078259B